MSVESREADNADSLGLVRTVAVACDGHPDKLTMQLHLTGDDPLDIASWTKLPGPAFTMANGEYSTGHNGFIRTQPA